MTTPIQPGSLWRHSKSGNPYVVLAVGKLEATEEEYVVYRPVDFEDGRDAGRRYAGDLSALPWQAIWVRPLREWEEPMPVPVCVVCHDKHKTDGGRLCTRCPIPCQRCRQDAVGAYCGKTPCACDCHEDAPVYVDWKVRAALPPVPRFVRVTP